MAARGATRYFGYSNFRNQSVSRIGQVLIAENVDCPVAVGKFW